MPGKHSWLNSGPNLPKKWSNQFICWENSLSCFEFLVTGSCTAKALSTNSRGWWNTFGLDMRSITFHGFPLNQHIASTTVASPCFIRNFPGTEISGFHSFALLLQQCKFASGGWWAAVSWLQSSPPPIRICVGLQLRSEMQFLDYSSSPSTVPHAPWNLLILNLK